MSLSLRRSAVTTNRETDTSHRLSPVLLYCPGKYSLGVSYQKGRNLQETESTQSSRSPQIRRMGSASSSVNNIKQHEQTSIPGEPDDYDKVLQRMMSSSPSDDPPYHCQAHPLRPYSASSISSASSAATAARVSWITPLRPAYCWLRRASSSPEPSLT